jgi:hypothetical protein
MCSKKLIFQSAEVMRDNRVAIGFVNEKGQDDKMVFISQQALIELLDSWVTRKFDYKHLK